MQPSDRTMAAAIVLASKTMRVVDNNVVKAYSDQKYYEAIFWITLPMTLCNHFLTLISHTLHSTYLNMVAQQCRNEVKVITTPDSVRCNPEPTVKYSTWKIPLKFVLGMYLWRLQFSTVLNANITKTSII
jgi:hypothetical protein